MTGSSDLSFEFNTQNVVAEPNLVVFTRKGGGWVEPKFSGWFLAYNRVYAEEVSIQGST